MGVLEMAVVGQAGTHFRPSMTARDLDRLQDTLGHRFANPDLLALALTHASAVNGSRGARQTYQELEFLGDRVLGLVVADMLTEEFPQATEGDLSRWFHRLVSGDVCAEVANERRNQPARRRRACSPTCARQSSPRSIATAGSRRREG
jgi:dsRNA-specific ribonuclease